MPLLAWLPCARHVGVDVGVTNQRCLSGQGSGVKGWNQVLVMVMRGKQAAIQQLNPGSDTPLATQCQVHCDLRTVTAADVIRQHFDQARRFTQSTVADRSIRLIIQSLLLDPDDTFLPHGKCTHLNMHLLAAELLCRENCCAGSIFPQDVPDRMSIK